MATGWLRGTVKEVPSGDTLVIVGTVKGGGCMTSVFAFMLALSYTCLHMLVSCVLSILNLQLRLLLRPSSSQSMRRSSARKAHHPCVPGRPETGEHSECVYLAYAFCFGLCKAVT